LILILVELVATKPAYLDGRSETGNGRVVYVMVSARLFFRGKLMDRLKAIEQNQILIVRALRELLANFGEIEEEGKPASTTISELERRLNPETYPSRGQR